MSLKQEEVFPERTEKKGKPFWKAGIPEEQYHALRTFLSASGLKEALRSPKHFYYQFVLGNSRKETPALELGRVIHAAVLEPERFIRDMVTKPKFDLRSRFGKSKAEQWLAENENKIHVDEKTHEVVLGILNSLSANKTISAMLSKSATEVSGFGYDPKTGLKLRIRPDAFLQAEGMILDIKSAVDASEKAFKRAVWDYGYYLQAAFYCFVASQIEGRKIEMFRWVVCEKSPPYDVAVYECDPAWMEIGEMDVRRALNRIDECLRTGVWYGYQRDGSEWLSPPLWLINQYAEQEEGEL